jgi:SecD/SecF fusion protein
MDGLLNLSHFLSHFPGQALVMANSQLNDPNVPAAAGEKPAEWYQPLVDYGYGPMFILGIFVIPFIVSHFLSRWLRVPQMSFRIGVLIASITGALLFASASNFQPKFGPDMKGGTTLVYDIMPDEEGNKINSSDLATALSDRLNPSGTKEISIVPRGESQIEITVPMVQENELQQIKELLQSSGQLEFRIVANLRDHENIVQLARAQALSNRTPKAEVLNPAGEPVGKWFAVGRDDKQVEGVIPFKTPVLGDIIRNSATGQIITVPPNLDTSRNYALERYLKQEGIEQVDVLMALRLGDRPYTEVAGDDLASATMEFDKTGEPTVAFRLTPSGATKMVGLTSVNQPDGEFHRRMAIIMDRRVLSAPQLNSPISNQGQITGRFTREEVEFLVTILRSGRLPATLSDQPASEARVGAGLGATTIQKGTVASVWSIILTFASILVYYRFSGMVASIALIINGLLIFGILIFIGQPITLPGLAGLVLTIGMSVDANVLIFERIREEKDKGAAPRMAIRNGFDRAFSTIVDSNLTTVIAAVVLYWIGTDQVRGFAVALIIGIATSMFTATFCARIFFELAEKMRVVSLSMTDGIGFIRKNFLGNRDVDFMSWQSYCFVASAVLIVASFIAVAIRGRELLNIDFTGGTSVTFRLEQPVEAERLRELTKEILATGPDGKPVQSTLVRVEKPPTDTVYTLVTSIVDREALSQQLLQGFAKDNAANLVTYRVKVSKPAPAEDTSGWWGIPTDVRLVSYQEPTTEGQPPADAIPVTDAATSTDTPPASGTESAATPSQATSADAASPTTSEAAPATTTPEPAAGQDALAVGVPSNATTEFLLEFGGSDDDNPEIDEQDRGAKYAGPTLKEQLITSAAEAGIEMNAALVEVAPEPRPAGWNEEDVTGYSSWRVSLPLDDASANAVITKLEEKLKQQPLWLSLSQIGGRVANEMQQRAVAAILVSLFFIVGYIWFRFQKISYGLAAVVALVHDVIITLGIVAFCHWLARPLGFLLIEDFKIGLTEVAAFLTIIGYSLNDTIVVFDRIREVRGRSPRLTAGMINSSVNQTLSRTLLTSGTTLLTVFVLYTFGGEGIHAFAFALLIGILVGTYSSIFIAAPMLLWLANRETAQNSRNSAAA